MDCIYLGNYSVVLFPNIRKKIGYIKLYDTFRGGRIPFDGIWEYLDKINEVNGVENIESSGTGFAIALGGYIATAYHVVKDEGIIQINSNNKLFEAEVIIKDRANDLAIIKQTEDIKYVNPLVLGDSSEVRLGEKIIALGYPITPILGESIKVTSGIISSLTGIDDDPRVFQISVPIHGGMSGGPLLNNSGEVVGVIIAKLDDSKFFRYSGEIPQNINYAIKSNYLKELIKTNSNIDLINFKEGEKKEIEDIVEIVKQSIFYISFTPNTNDNKQKVSKPARIDNRGKLTGIIGGLAIIGGKMYKIGDTINGYSITDITNDYIAIERDGETNKYCLGSQVVK